MYQRFVLDVLFCDLAWTCNAPTFVGNVIGGATSACSSGQALTYPTTCSVTCATGYDPTTDTSIGCTADGIATAFSCTGFLSDFSSFLDADSI